MYDLITLQRKSNGKEHENCKLSQDKKKARFGSRNLVIKLKPQGIRNVLHKTVVTTHSAKFIVHFIDYIKLFLSNCKCMGILHKVT